MKRSTMMYLFASLLFCGCCTDDFDAGPNGCPCEENADCQSGYCAHNMVCTDPGRQGELFINGDACSSDDQCASNHCYEGRYCRSPNRGNAENTFSSDPATTDAKTTSGQKTNDADAAKDAADKKTNDADAAKTTSDEKTGNSGDNHPATDDDSLQSVIIKAYCEKLMNQCVDQGYSFIYDSYEGCVKVENMHRNIYPECQVEYDQAIDCANSMTCKVITSGNYFLDALKDSSSFVKGCTPFAKQFIACRDK